MPESTHTLSDLAQQLGPATDADLRNHFQGIDDGVPIALGKKVATSRIVTDAPYIIGSALVFLESASDDQKDWLAGVTTDTLRLAVGATWQANELYRARKEAIKTSRNKLAEQTAMSSQVLDTAMARRTVLHGILTKIACGTEPYASRITSAYSKSEEPLEVCNALDALVDLGRELIKDKDPGVVTRRKTTRLSAAWLDAAVAVSAKLREAGERANAVRTTPDVAQGEVDLHDGWALMLLNDIVDAFDDANAADATIPRIQVYSLRNVLRPASGKKTKSEPTAPPTDHG